MKIMVMLEIVRRYLQRIGPYVVIEVLLPGGTLLALLLLLYRSGRLHVWHPERAELAQVPAAVHVVGRPVPTLRLSWDAVGG